MVIIVWNPSGFYLISVLPSGCKFNRSYHQSEILELLSEWRREQARGPGRKLVADVDNALPQRHTAAVSQELVEENGRERVIDPPYLLDLAFSD
jgi:hypothetical protein